MKAILSFAQQIRSKIASFGQKMDGFWNLYKKETVSTASS